MAGTIWAVLGLLLIFSEFLSPQFIIFFFGAGALLNALLVTIVPFIKSHIPFQIVLWLFTSGLSLVLLRKYASRWFRGEMFHQDDSAIRGQTATVIEAIGENLPGRIRFGGTTWEAESLEGPIPEGATVTILQKEGLSVVVTAGDLLDDDSGV